MKELRTQFEYLGEGPPECDKIRNVPELVKKVESLRDWINGPIARRIGWDHEAGPGGAGDLCSHLISDLECAAQRLRLPIQGNFFHLDKNRALKVLDGLWCCAMMFLQATRAEKLSAPTLVTNTVPAQIASPQSEEEQRNFAAEQNAGMNDPHVRARRDPSLILARDSARCPFEFDPKSPDVKRFSLPFRPGLGMFACLFLIKDQWYLYNPRPDLPPENQPIYADFLSREDARDRFLKHGALVPDELAELRPAKEPTPIDPMPEDSVSRQSDPGPRPIPNSKTPKRNKSENPSGDLAAAKSNRSCINFLEWGIGLDPTTGWHVFQFKSNGWKHARKKLKVPKGVLWHMLDSLLANKGNLRKQDILKFYATPAQPKKLNPILTRLRRAISDGIGLADKRNVLPKDQINACWRLEIRIGHAEKTDSVFIDADPPLSFLPCE